MNYLVGQTIRLEKFSEGHITDEYIGWLNDHEISRFLCTGRYPIIKEEVVVPSGNDNMRFAIMEIVKQPEKKEPNVYYNYVDKYIGTISLHKIDWISRHGEIGYIIGNKNYWGKGIATEAVGLISDYGFNRLNLHKIEAGVVGGNIGSIKALEKNRFIEYGKIPDDYFLEGKYYDTIRFYRLQEWK